MKSRDQLEAAVRKVQEDHDLTTVVTIRLVLLVAMDMIGLNKDGTREPPLPPQSSKSFREKLEEGFSQEAEEPQSAMAQVRELLLEFGDVVREVLKRELDLDILIALNPRRGGEVGWELGALLPEKNPAPEYLMRVEFYRGKLELYAPGIVGRYDNVETLSLALVELTRSKHYRYCLRCLKNALI